MEVTLATITLEPATVVEHLAVVSVPSVITDKNHTQQRPRKPRVSTHAANSRSNDTLIKEDTSQHDQPT